MDVRGANDGGSVLPVAEASVACDGARPRLPCKRPASALDEFVSSARRKMDQACDAILDGESVALCMQTVRDAKQRVVETHAQQMALQAWFTHSYRVPDVLLSADPSGAPWQLAAPRAVGRGELRDSANQFLDRLDLPLLRKHDALWRDWFAAHILTPAGVPDAHGNRPLQLCVLRSREQLANGAEQLARTLRTM